MASSKVSRLKQVARQYSRHPSGSGKGGQFAPKEDVSPGPVSAPATSTSKARLKAKAKQVVGVPEPSPGPPYTKTKRIGNGDYSEIHLTDRKTAVKSTVVRPPITPDGINREMQAYRELGELGLTPRLLSQGDPATLKKGGTFEFEMEYLAGYKTPKVASDGWSSPLPPEQYSTLEGQFHGAHRRGWTHGDLHPGNVMINGKTGDVKIIDMAFAKKFESGSAQEFDDFASLIMDDWDGMESFQPKDHQPTDLGQRYQTFFSDVKGIRKQYAHPDTGMYGSRDSQARAAFEEAYRRFQG